VLPRIQGQSGFQRWSNVQTPLMMEYESLVEIGGNVASLIMIQQTGSPEQRDLLTSLRGFQLRSKVTVIGRPQPNGAIQINFPWTSRRSRARRSLPSWATSTTARPRCSITSARPASPQVKPAA
jgi:hypothetical protein